MPAASTVALALGLRIHASYVSKAIMAVTGVALAVFTVAFIDSLYGVFGQISTAANFFGSADVLMYVSIEGVFLIGVVAAGFYVLWKAS
jgi:hypothetical protein